MTTIYCQHCGKVAIDPCYYDMDEQEKAYYDADRYRWLRENPAFETEALLSGLTPEQFDELVDQRRASVRVTADNTGEGR